GDAGDDGRRQLPLDGEVPLLDVRGNEVPGDGSDALSPDRALAGERIGELEAWNIVGDVILERLIGAEGPAAESTQQGVRQARVIESVAGAEDGSVARAGAVRNRDARTEVVLVAREQRPFRVARALRRYDGDVLGEERADQGGEHGLVGHHQVAGG